MAEFRGTTASPLVTTVSVTTQGALQQAAALVRSSTIISMAPATYRLTRPLTLTGSPQNVKLQQHGDAADAILIGPPASTTTPLRSSIVATATERLTPSYLTIMYTPGYAITLGNGVQQPHLRTLRIIGNGRVVQSPLHASGLGAAGGVVENCWFEYVGSATGLPSALDIRGGQNCNVRGIHFVDPGSRDAGDLRAGGACLAGERQNRGGTQHVRQHDTRMRLSRRSITTSRTEAARTTRGGPPAGGCWRPLVREAAVGARAYQMRARCSGAM